MAKALLVDKLWGLWSPSSQTWWWVDSVVWWTFDPRMAHAQAVTVKASGWLSGIEADWEPRRIGEDGYPIPKED